MKRFLSGLVVVSVLGCSVLIDTGAEVQCSTTEDCLKRGKDFVGSVCAVDKCVLPPPQNECTDNLSCGGGVCLASASDGLKRCEKVDLTTCTRAVGDPLASDVHVIGMLGDFGPQDSAYADDNYAFLGAQLAIRDWNEKVKFPSQEVKKAGRTAVLLACSQSAPRTSAQALVKVGAAAIVGPTKDVALDPAAEQSVPGALTMIGGWISDTATPVEASSGRVWLTSPPRSELIAPLNAIFEQSSAALKTQAGVNGTAPLRVAMIVEDGNYATLGPLVDERLRFNGKSALENQNDTGCGNCYKRFDLAKVTPADMVAFAPTVIISYASRAFGTNVLPGLDAALRAATQKPVYISPVYEEDDGFAAQITDRKRVLLLGPTQASSYAAFANAFREQFGVSPRIASAKAYEATQLALYGMYSTTQRTVGQDKALGISARNVSAALASGRVTSSNVDAPLVNAGKSEILEKGIAALKEGAKASQDIHYVGLLSPMEFDPIRFTAVGAYSLYCINSGGTSVPSGTNFVKGAFDKAVALCP